MLGWIRSHIGGKLFLSYLFVIFVGTIILALTTTWVAPRSFDAHLAGMESMMGGDGMMGGSGMMGSGMMGNGATDTLFVNFDSAVRESLAWAALAAVVTAVAASAFVTRRLVAPVGQMTQASQRIAGGNYQDRVHLPTGVSPGELDELGRLAHSFNQMAAALEQTENLRRQLIGDVAHELRTPLTTIKGSMEGLIDGVLPASQQTYQQVYKEADRLQRLVDDLQELSRVEAGAFELDKASHTVEGLAQPALERLANPFRQKGVALDARIPAGLPRVPADLDRITQVLTNLLGNALQSTSEGGEVVVSAVQKGKEIVISVRDDGVGLSPEHLELIFTRFYRVDKSRSRAGGGSGIGLTIAKHLVEAHGGRIWAQSEGPGRGSNFYFSLPLEND